MTITALGAWALRKQLVGHELNGELAGVPEPLRSFLGHMGSLSTEQRPIALDGYLYGFADRDECVRAIAEADPTGPAPESAGPRRSAHLGDLARSQANGRFVWPGWIVRGHFNLLSSDVKVGKTHLMLDLARRFFFGLPLPDDQDPPFPEGTCTLWVCGDRHQDELRERARAFGLPDEAVRLNALPDSPYGGWNLDDPENVALMRELVESERPGAVIIDTVWRATQRRLRCEEEVNALLTPILDIAQATDTAIIGLMHLSKDGETLGRRLEGLARSVMKLYRPDPEGQPARRKLTVIGNFKEPPPMGVTYHDDRCDFDFTPPSEPEQSRGGRPPEKIGKAVEFLSEKLAQGPRKAVDLVNEWEALDESKSTLFNARKAMEEDGRLVVDTVKKPQMWQLVKNQSEDKNQDSDRF